MKVSSVVWWNVLFALYMFPPPSFPPSRAVLAACFQRRCRLRGFSCPFCLCEFSPCPSGLCMMYHDHTAGCSKLWLRRVNRSGCVAAAPRPPAPLFGEDGINSSNSGVLSRNQTAMLSKALFLLYYCEIR